MGSSSFGKVIGSTDKPDPQLRIFYRLDAPIFEMQKSKGFGGPLFVRRVLHFTTEVNDVSKSVVSLR